ncbi:MAG: glycosyltransferase [Bacteroidota bacterium]|nr:glycosyltransferase [Bacteroidota bacterium]
MKNLLCDDNPILMEGLHCCFYLDDQRLSERKKIVRTHNVEQHYYQKLSQAERNPIKKIYFLQEAAKLESFEKKLLNASALAAISVLDTEFYLQKHKNTKTISAFHPDNKLSIVAGNGDFVLYHGNLSVGENNAAALFLVKEIFSKINTSFIIAGNKPTEELKLEAERYDNIQLIDNYSTKQITDLIRKAHINLLPTFQATGIKLKLLSALHNGRFCLVNSPMVKGTGLEKFCIIKDSPSEIISEIKNLMLLPFSNQDIKLREELLTGDFSNAVNADRLIEIIED